MTYKPNPVYEFFDDWGDNLLTGRQFSGDKLVTPDSPFLVRCKNFRPEWTTESGSPSASGGVLVLPAGDATSQIISISTTFFVGTWEIDSQLQASPTTGADFAFQFMAGGSEKYHIAWINNDGYEIYDTVDGAGVVSATHTVDTSWHTFKATRDSSSNWELFFDGASDGIGTDATTTSIDALQIKNNMDVEIHYDSLKIY